MTKTPKISLIATTLNAEKLIEEAGRTCYMSQYKITLKSSISFIQRCIKSGHHSILEHASATFKIIGASRAFTHQLVRHRLASFSQQSQRYVNETDFNYIIPPEIFNDKEACRKFKDFIELSRKTYQELRDKGIKKEDARYVLPNALESQIIFTANFRELRHIFSIRLKKNAQWEIRRVCFKMLEIMQREAPAVFGDFDIDTENCTARSNNE